MGVLEDKHRKLIWEKVIPSCFLMLLFLTRFLPFYEIEGIRVEIGFHSSVYHKILVGTVALTFLMATWKNNINNIIRLFLQNISILAMILYDILHLFFEDYKFKHAGIGFWIHTAISIIAIGYCFLMGSRAVRGHK